MKNDSTVPEPSLSRLHRARIHAGRVVANGGLNSIDTMTSDLCGPPAWKVGTGEPAITVNFSGRAVPASARLDPKKPAGVTPASNPGLWPPAYPNRRSRHYGPEVAHHA
jgi:hypothetical protein